MIGIRIKHVCKQLINNAAIVIVMRNATNSRRSQSIHECAGVVPGKLLIFNCKQRYKRSKANSHFDVFNRSHANRIHDSHQMSNGCR